MQFGPRGFRRKDATTAIVSFGTGLYQPYLDRLRVSVRRHSPHIPVFTYSDFAEIGSPTHAENPYAFKVYAIEKVRAMGYRYVLCCNNGWLFVSLRKH